MKTHKGIVKKIAQLLGNGSVVHHEITHENLLGQSGVHTFVDDILDVLEESGSTISHPEAFKALTRFILDL